MEQNKCRVLHQYMPTSLSFCLLRVFTKGSSSSVDMDVPA